MGGSQMFLEVGERVKVEDLIRGVIIQSGNDACVTLAEAIAGSEEEFARQMNEKAPNLAWPAARSPTRPGSMPQIV